MTILIILIILILALVLLSLACRPVRRNDYRVDKEIGGFEALECLRRAQGKEK